MRNLPTKNKVHFIARTLEVLAISVCFLVPDPVIAQADLPVEIASPADGAVLAGVVEIRGTVTAANFLSAALAFSYDGATDSPWFNIMDIPGPVSNDRLALWDTSAISDGAYALRLRLNGTDGTVHDVAIKVQVRNYTSAATVILPATSTPLPVLRISTPVVVAASPASPRIQAETPTPLPPNPARITQSDLIAGFARGGLAVLAIFLLWGAVNLRGRL